MLKENNMKKARLNLIISMTAFGTIGLFVRNIELSSAKIALFRAVLASVFIGIFLVFRKRKIDFGKIKKELLLLLISGAAMGFNWIFLFEAYNYTTVSAATLSYYFAPVIVTVLCPLIFREKMGIKEWICFFGSTLGIVMITGIGDFAEGSGHMKGIALGLLAALLYATVIILNKFIKNVEGTERTLFQFLSAAMVLTPYIAFTEGFSDVSLDLKGTICLLTVGLIHTGICYILYFSSLSYLPGQKVALLSYIDPLVAVICSAFILREDMTLMQIAGGILILGFTLYNEIVKKEGK